MTTKQTEGERLVKLEVKVENIENLVVKMDTKLDDILKEQNNVRSQHVSRTELESEIRRLESSLESNAAKVEKSILETKRRHSVTVWVTTTLAALVSVAITLLSTFFFQNIGR